MDRQLRSPSQLQLDLRPHGLQGHVQGKDAEGPITD